MSGRTCAGPKDEERDQPHAAIRVAFARSSSSVSFALAAEPVHSIIRHALVGLLLISTGCQTQVAPAPVCKGVVTAPDNPSAISRTYFHTLDEAMLYLTLYDSANRRLPGFQYRVLAPRLANRRTISSVGQHATQGSGLIFKLRNSMR